MGGGKVIPVVTSYYVWLSGFDDETNPTITICFVGQCTLILGGPVVSNDVVDYGVDVLQKVAQNSTPGASSRVCFFFLQIVTDLMHRK